MNRPLLEGVDYESLRRWKYRTTRAVVFHTGWHIPNQMATRLEYAELEPDGTLYVNKGYAWDGPSGPMPDFASAMRASLAHDALYQLMREGKLPAAIFRHRADELFRDVCIEDGMVDWLAIYSCHLLKKFAHYAAEAVRSAK